MAVKFLHVYLSETSVECELNPLIEDKQTGLFIIKSFSFQSFKISETEIRKVFHFCLKLEWLWVFKSSKIVGLKLLAQFYLLCANLFDKFGQPNPGILDLLELKYIFHLSDDRKKSGLAPTPPCLPSPPPPPPSPPPPLWPATLLGRPTPPSRPSPRAMLPEASRQHPSVESNLSTKLHIQNFADFVCVFVCAAIFEMCGWRRFKGHLLRYF